MKKKGILITGGKGFIGQALNKKLLNLGYKTICLPRGKLDVTRAQDFNHLSKVDVIYHLAAKTFAPDSWENPHDFIKTNIIGTLNVLEYARKSKIKPLIVLASSFVYGKVTKLPISETHSMYAANPYMCTKIEAESLCRFYCETWGIPIIALRVFNIYGPNQDKRFLIPQIISELNLRTINLKDPKPKRDFIYIDDVISAYVSALKHKKGFEVVNIASGKSYSVSQVANALIQLSNSQAKIHYEKQTRINEIMDTRADISKAKKLLNWKPRVDLIDGLKKTLTTSKV